MLIATLLAGRRCLATCSRRVALIKEYAPMPLPTDSGKESPRKTLLHLEHSLAHLELIEALAQRLPSVRVLPAIQGRRGLELAQQHRPDAVLLDVHLPDLSAQEVLRRF